MTEQEWLKCDDPEKMVRFLHGRASDRKLRLFGCAACRCVWDLFTEECFRTAVEVAEKFADGNASGKDLIAAKKESGAALEISGLRGITGTVLWGLGSAWSTTRNAITAAIYPTWVFTDHPDRKRHVSLLADLFGNPFRTLVVDPSWQTQPAIHIAEGIYTDRAFDRLPILADALEEAGCTDADILAHCRSDGPHVRGCWVVDLILGKK
jgi:hypothetical protein